MRKLIAVDIDGTLINSDYKITKRTKEALIQAQKEGHKLVISSGRSPSGIEGYAYELEMDKYESYISAQNGTIVVDMKTKERVIEHFLEIDLVRDILTYSEDIGMDYMIYRGDQIYSNKKETYKLAEVIEKNSDSEVILDKDLAKNIDFRPHNILFAQDETTISKPAKLLLDKYGDQTSQMYSETYYYEIMPKDVSKGHTLLEIAEYLGIDKENIIAFGDQDNDMSMIKMAGVGVAMGNAIDSLKEAADYVTLTNNEDGIAAYLEKYLLNK